VAQNRPLWTLMSAFGATRCYAPLVVLATQEEEEEKSRALTASPFQVVVQYILVPIK